MIMNYEYECTERLAEDALFAARAAERRVRAEGQRVVLVLTRLDQSVLERRAPIACAQN